MGSRKAKRQVAKARLTAMGVGNVNKKMALRKDPKDRTELPNWKKALYGKTGQDAERAQMNLGKLLKARKENRDIVRRRKLKKVVA